MKFQLIINSFSLITRMYQYCLYNTPFTDFKLLKKKSFLIILLLKKKKKDCYRSWMIYNRQIKTNYYSLAIAAPLTAKYNMYTV